MKLSTLIVVAFLTVFSVQLATAASDDIESLIETCSATVEGMTDDLKARYRANEYPDDPVTHCFVRCVGLTLNLYTDEDGVDLEANWKHLGKGVGDEEDQFIANHRACLDGRNLNAIENLCDRAYSAFQCLKEEYGMDQTGQN